MNGLEKIERVIDTIERELTAQISYEELAAQMALSLYEFRRIFSFLVGCPISDYIRKRRLSLAACELMGNRRLSVHSVGERYGYATLAAFSKAFSEYHGFSPSACQRGEGSIKLFSRPKFEVHIKSASDHAFQIVNDGEYAILGYLATSDTSDTCCCEGVWNDFYALKKDEEITDDKLFVSYQSEGGRVRCCIGQRVAPEKGQTTVPESRWLCVKMNTTDDEAVNAKYSEILYELLPSAKLRRNADLPTVEVFPKDMSTDDFEWEIRIPIE